MSGCKTPVGGMIDQPRHPSWRTNGEIDGASRAFALLAAIREGELLAEVPGDATGRARHELGLTLLDMAVDALADLDQARRADAQR